MEQNIKENIKDLLSYLNDEDKHFWENCECSEEIQETEDFDKCNCDVNENHIFRSVVSVRSWLDNPSSKVIKIEVEGGLVQDVNGLPDGYTYEIDDKDILEGDL